jgi:hypothetical protein
MDEPQYVYDTRPDAGTMRAFVDPAQIRGPQMNLFK